MFLQNRNGGAMKTVINIELFNEFKIIYQDREVIVNRQLGKKLVNLLQFFVFNISELSN